MIRPLDHIDRKILTALLDNARLTNAELAQRVGLSPSPCWQRVRRLQDDGYIVGYTVVLDQERLGPSETVLVEISLDHHDDETLQRFESALLAMPEVLEVYLTSGEHDYFVKVATDSTTGYEEFLRTKLFKVPGIRQTRSSFSLKRVKQIHAYIP